MVGTASVRKGADMGVRIWLACCHQPELEARVMADLSQTRMR
jgi:hypothetical protein